MKKAKRFNGEGGTSFIDEFETKRKEKPVESDGEAPAGQWRSIDSDVRKKAMDYVKDASEESRYTKPPAAKIISKAAPKVTTKLAAPDYSNEDLDRMGMNEDLKPAAPVVPAKKKPYIDIPEKSNIGLRQFKTMASGGKVSSASSRADGCAVRGKTKGRMV